MQEAPSADFVYPSGQSPGCLIPQLGVPSHRSSWPPLRHSYFCSVLVLREGLYTLMLLFPAVTTFRSVEITLEDITSPSPHRMDAASLLYRSIATAAAVPGLLIASTLKV